MEEYLLRPDTERKARVAGQVVAADLYARQLTSMEVAITRGGLTEELLERLGRDPRRAMTSSPRR